MYRLRKKSDAKRAPVLEQLQPLQVQAKPPEPVPTLPPADDFRTSLILPDLLRASSGTPIALDDLKSKFAEQRARGSRNQVTEEEEDMILEALGRLHARAARTRVTNGKEASNEQSDARTESQDLGSHVSLSSPTRDSVQSSSTTPTALHSITSMSSLSSGKGSNVSRRMSNNLFGSGKLRDQTYIRSANHGRRPGGSRTVSSVAPSESMMSMSTVSSSRAGQSSMYSDSLRPGTPDGSTYTPSNSVPSSPNNDKVFEKQRAGRSVPQDSDAESGADKKDLTTRLSRALSPDVLRRASMALDEVIREMEEEGDDEIVMERIALPQVHGTASNGSASTPTEYRSPFAPPGEYGTAVSSDDRVVTPQNQAQTTEMRSPTASPAPRLPGYIPGMPRPMTPRDSTFDSDDLTPSSTPRATSPRLPSGTPPSPRVPQPLTSSLYRSNSAASSSRQSPAPISTPTLATTPPLFFNRSVHGQFTPEDRQRSGTSSPVMDVFDSSAPSRRRPMSPLSGPAYQALTNSSSRPSTPSNVTWNTGPNATTSHASAKSMDGSLHSKEGSTISVGDVLTEGLERMKSTSRSLRSPALPESPFMDRNYGLSMAMESEYRPPSAMSGMELGSPLQMNNRPLRSPTPTYSRQKSPTTAVFPEGINGSSSGETSNPSRRSLKQNHHSSFSLGSSTGLLLSPIANSSRSSIESAGSSYHSWDEEHRKDRLYGLFSSLDPDHTEWHDISALDKSASSTPGTSPYESLDVEETVRKNTGLTKGDFIAIQDRLIKAAVLKVQTPDGRVRANSLRRRRPSTSQSNYSLTENRVASPAPHVQPVVVAAPSRVSDHNAKVNALLESVVDSIESPRVKAPASLPVPEPHVQPEPVTSSPNRRQKALADALFGMDASERPPTPSAQALLSPGPEGRRSRAHTPEVAPNSPSSPPSVTTLTQTTSTLKSPTSPGFSMSQTNVSHVDAMRLAMEVQQRAEAATAALRKSPSIPKLGDPTNVPHPHRKRINPKQISSPTLVSSSTSLDTIPIPPHKVSRFRKLTGTLRAKDIPLHALEQHPPASAPLPGHSPRFSPPDVGQPDQAALKPQVHDHRKTSSPDPSPPASASPGLKGFISRFRKPKNTESYSATQRERSSPSLTALSPSSPSFNSLPATQGPRSAPALQTYFDQPVASATRVPPAAVTESRALLQEVDSPDTAEEPPAQPDDAALKQLFAAASDLGLDQRELQSLLARSPSTSSKLTRNTSVTESRKSHLPGVREDDVADCSPSPILPRGKPSMGGYPNRPVQDGFRPSVENVPEIRLRPPREGPADAAVNPIVRRTIIFPDTRSSALDLNALMRKQSAARKRRSAGANSTYSNRSVHERVPTPPPHKHTGRRFSTDGSPPVPQLPISMGSQGEQLLAPGQLEPSNSAYDSLYEMYTGEGKASGAGNLESHGASETQQSDANTENGPALELIELANGEMIWNIVNGLRDDDGESLYGDRSSFVSEYSRRDSAGDGLRLFFKGHEKKGSKGSNMSTSTRKRPYPKPPVRPETKVFFSSSAQIGQLIDNLSRGVDSGSFNIAPEASQARQPVGHSASSSIGSENEARWTLEESRLQQLLGSLGPTQ